MTDQKPKRTTHSAATPPIPKHTPEYETITSAQAAYAAFDRRIDDLNTRITNLEEVDAPEPTRATPEWIAWVRSALNILARNKKIDIGKEPR